MTRRSPMLKALERWDRPRDARIVAGVCAAIAEHTGIHPMLVRFAFAVLALAKGIGVIAYLVLWLLLPGEGERLAGGTFRDAMRGRLRTAGEDASSSFDGIRAALARGRSGSPWPRPLDRWWLGTGVAAVGVLIVAASFGLFDWITPTRALGLAAVAGGIGLIVTSPGGR